MGKAYKVRGPNGKPMVVDRRLRKFRGTSRRTLLRRHYFQGGLVNDEYIEQGYYFWPFWSAIIVNDDNTPVHQSHTTDSSSFTPDPTPASTHHYTPAPDHTVHHVPAAEPTSHHSPSYGYHDSGSHHSSSHDSGSSHSSHDSGSSGGGDSGGGGGGGGGGGD